MKTVETSPSYGDATLDPKEWLCGQRSPRSVVSLFEDCDTLEPAMDLHQQTITWLWGNDLDCSWWKLDTLSHPAVADAAAESAAKAELIIFSVHAETELSEAVKTWVETRLSPARGPESAIIVLVNGELPRTLARSPALGYLQEQAQNGKMRFLAQFRAGRAAEPRFSLAEFQPSQYGNGRVERNALAHTQ